MTAATGWLDSIPEHWERKKLKYVASLRSGESITSDSIAPEGPYPVFGGNGLRGYTMSFTHRGDHVLIGRQGALCGNVNYASGEFWASEHAIVAEIRDGSETRWLGELLRSMNLNQYSESAAQPGLSVEAIANLEIPIPPVDEQRAIAGYVEGETGHIDALITAKERLLALLAEKRRTLVTHAATRGLEPEVRLLQSSSPYIDMLPAHWRCTRLKYVADVRGGLTLGMNYGSEELLEYPYLRVANVQDGYVDLSNMATVLVPRSVAESALLREGDVLLNEGGDADKVGRGCVWHGEISPCLHQNHVFAVRPTTTTSAWISAWIATDNAKQYFESRAKRSTNLASISATTVGELPMLIPPLDEQAAILDHIAAEVALLDAIRSATERSIALLRERRMALVATVVAGQVRVQVGL